MPRPNHSIFPDQSRECWTRLRHYAGPLQGQKLVVPPAGVKNNASHKRHTHNPRHADRRSRRRLRERSKTFSELPLTGRVSTESRRQRILGGLHATSRFRQGSPRSVLSWPALRRSDTRIRSQTREARRTSIHRTTTSSRGRVRKTAAASPPWTQPRPRPRPPRTQPRPQSRPPWTYPRPQSRPPWAQPRPQHRPPWTQPRSRSRPPWEQPRPRPHPPQTLPWSGRPPKSTRTRSRRPAQTPRQETHTSRD